MPGGTFAVVTSGSQNRFPGSVLVLLFLWNAKDTGNAQLDGDEETLFKLCRGSTESYFLKEIFQQHILTSTRQTQWIHQGTKDL